MARIGVTLQDVEDAAARLKLQGKPPTVARVREFLGTGSNSTIAKHLKSWRDNQYANLQTSLPESIPKSLIPAIELFWSQSVKEANKHFAEKETEWHKSKQALQSMKEDFEFELNKTLNTNEKLKRELEKLKQSNRELKLDTDEVIKSLKQENKALKIQLIKNGRPE